MRAKTLEEDREMSLVRVMAVLKACEGVRGIINYLNGPIDDCWKKKKSRGILVIPQYI